MSRAETLPLEPVAMEPVTPTERLLVSAPNGPSQVLALMTQALQSGIPVESIREIAALYREEQDRAAAREFAADLAKFQGTVKAVPRTSTASIVSEAKGTKFSYKYAELDQIAETVGKDLHALGFSFSWDSTTSDKMIAVICTLRHRNGHSEDATFSCPVDSTSRMNAQQQHAAALTYAKRQSLVQVLGLTMTDPDPDADLAPGTIGPQQEALLASLLDEVKADKAKFLKWLGVSALGEVREQDYARAINALEQKRTKP
jgi:ERF superfamily protein